MLTSTTNHTGCVINGVTLGEPAFDPETGVYCWDHGTLPEGEVDELGQITVTVTDMKDGKVKAEKAGSVGDVVNVALAARSAVAVEAQMVEHAAKLELAAVESAEAKK